MLKTYGQGRDGRWRVAEGPGGDPREGRKRELEEVEGREGRKGAGDASVGARFGGGEGGRRKGQLRRTTSMVRYSLKSVSEPFWVHANIDLAT